MNSGRCSRWVLTSSRSFNDAAKLAQELPELDGWWAEAAAPDVGWALGDGKEHDSDPAWDALEAEQLYTMLEDKIIPEFYNRDQSGLPVEWVKKICESMARLTPAFSANRAVREYTENYYLPAADNYLARSADNGKLGVELLDWRRRVADHLPRLRFDEPKVETCGDRHCFCVQAYLDEIDPDAVRMELYAEGRDGAPPFRQVMTRGNLLAGTTNAYSFSAAVPGDRPAEEYTPRIVPYHAAAAVPLEAPQILWYR